MSDAPPLLANRYEVAELVYRDATVAVYRGFDQLLNRAVGIELLNVGASADQARAMEDKARRMALAELPHVAALYDQGEQDGRSFLVMEELAQSSLGEVAPLPASATANLVAALATTLRTAARKGTPPPRIDADSIRVTPDGLFQIVNWGIARPGTPNDVALVTPVLVLAAEGAMAQPTHGALSPLGRVVERARDGTYGTLDALVADVEAARTTADDPTVVVRRGRPTIMLPDGPPRSHDAPQRAGRTRPAWLPLVLVAMLLLVGAAFASRFITSRSQGSDQPAAGVSETALAGSTATPAGPAPTAQPQGQPFVVATNTGQRLNVRSGPGRNNPVVGRLNNGSVVQVLEGPVEGGGQRWARIQGEGVAGWCLYDALRAQ
jgi:hypothetical protein